MYQLVTPILALTLSILLVSCGGGSGSDESDPASPDQAIAYVKRPLYYGVDDGGEPAPIEFDILQPDRFNGGARLFIRQRASSGDEVDIIQQAIDRGDLPSGDYDVKDLAVSPDGSKLAFAMRLPQDPNLDEDDAGQPSWNIWEYTLESDTLRIIINTAEAEEGHDVSPSYLPDGRIVFSSNRQKSITTLAGNEIGIGSSTEPGLNDIDYGAANENAVTLGARFNLHVMNADPAVILSQTIDIRQITFNNSNDLEPTLLSNGKIAYLRWDATGNNDQLSLYTTNPDGSDTSFLYGFHSQNTVTLSDNSTAQATFFDLDQLPDGRLLAILKIRDSEGLTSRLGGDLIALNTRQFTEIDKPISGASGRGQASLTNLGIDVSDGISANGYISTATPYNDGSGRLFVSWTPCFLVSPNDPDQSISCTGNLNDPNATEADPRFGLFTYIPGGGSTRLLEIAPPSPGQMYSDVIAIAPATNVPEFIADNPSSSNYGTLMIDSVYDFDGQLMFTPNDASLTELADPTNAAFQAREARFIRIIKPLNVSASNLADSTASNNVGNRTWKMIVGYAPIEPDGSVAVQVPAEIPFQIEIVDGTGQMLRNFPSHQTWLELAAGEIKRCTGCHSDDSDEVHGRRDAEAPSLNTGLSANELPFPNTDRAPDALLLNSLYNNESTLTMAQVYYAENDQGRQLSPNLEYTDDWSAATLTPEDAISLRYQSAELPVTPLVPALPIPNDACTDSWGPTCRIAIDYPTHIQPIWEADRLDPSDPSRNYACVNCHVAGAEQQAGHLDLSAQGEPRFASYNDLVDDNQDGASTPATPLSFVFEGQVQLFLTETDDNGTPDDPLDDTEVRVRDAIYNEEIPLVEEVIVNEDNEDSLLVQRYDFSDVLNPTPVFMMIDDPDSDDPSDLIRAQFNGQDIPVTDPFVDTRDPNRMRPTNARGSVFFDIMSDPTNANNVDSSTDNSDSSFDHSRLNQADSNDTTPLLSPEELRLISEWLDIGAQYYNNPFNAP